MILSSRKDRITSAWYVQYLDDDGREQMTTYIDFAEARRAFNALERPARFGLVYSNGRLQAYAVKEVSDDGET